MSASVSEDRPVKSLIPVRMDRMPWSKFHWLPSTLTRVAGAIGRGVVAAAGTAGRPGYRPPPRA